MNRDLKRRLIEVGFPFDWKKPCPNCCEEGSHSNCPSQEPSLSELIRACGEKFECLVREDYMCPVFYKAYPKEEYYKGDCVVDCCGYETGDTPEEAVAKLYIKLYE